MTDLISHDPDDLGSGSTVMMTSCQLVGPGKSFGHFVVLGGDSWSGAETNMNHVSVFSDNITCSLQCCISSAATPLLLFTERSPGREINPRKGGQPFSKPEILRIRHFLNQFSVNYIKAEY